MKVEVMYLATPLRALLWQVAGALVLPLLLLSYLQGGRWLANGLYSLVIATVFEGLMLAARGKPLRGCLDGSIAITALILALTLPQSAPLWLLTVANGFAVIFGKQLYGGLGFNIFNPAMVAYCFCLLSFPVAISQQPAQPLEFFSLFSPPSDLNTAATLLDRSRQLRLAAAPMVNALNPDKLALNSLYLLSAIGLAWRRCLDFRISLAYLLGALAAALAFYGYDGSKYLAPLVRLNEGGLIFAACFIATDPCTCATSLRGRWLFGLFTGALAVAIGYLGNYADGVAFAMLLGNGLVPLIDPWTAPKYE